MGIYQSQLEALQEQVLHLTQELEKLTEQHYQLCADMAQHDKDIARLQRQLFSFDGRGD